MPSKTNSTSQQSGPPADYADAYRALTGAAANIAQSPLNQYAGPMVAGFTPQQQAAFQTIDNSQGMWTPFINAAAQQYGAGTAPLWKGLPQFDTSDLPGMGKVGLNMALSSANKASGFADRAVQPFDVPGYDTLPTYFNPYQSYVTDTLKNLFNTQNGEQFAQMRGNAALHGAYGGDRDVIAQSVVARQQKIANDAALAQVQQQGFAQAQQELNNQQDLALRKGLGMGQLALGAGNLTLGTGNLGLQGGQAAFNEFNNQQATQLQADLANRGLSMQAGAGYGNLGNMAQGLSLSGAQAQLGAGGLQQQLAQSQLNVPYQQFMQAQAYPYQALSFLSPIVQGTGSLSGGIGTTSSPGPSTMSQIGGLGLTGAGIYGLANKFWGGADGGGGTGGLYRRGGRIGFADGGSAFDLPDIPGIGHDVPTVDLSFIPHVVPGTERPSPYGMGSGASQPNSGAKASGGGDDVMGGIGTAVSMAAKFLPLLLASGGRAGFAQGGETQPDTQGGMGTPHGLPAIPKINLDYMIPPGPAVKGAGPPKPPPASGLTPAGSDSGRMLDWTKDLKSSGLLGTTESGTTSHSTGGGVGHFQAGGASGMDGGGDSAYQQLLTMPVAQLQAMATQNPPSTPLGQMIVQALAAQQQSGASPGSPPPVGGAGGMGTAALPTAAAGTSRLATAAQDFGGTAYPMAAGGQVPGYVTEDELDPHPVVDHSGRTVKVRYPSEGRELDLGLPSIRRPDFDAGGSAGSAPEMPVPQVEMPGMSSYMGYGGMRVPQFNVAGGERPTIFGGVGRGTTRWMEPGAGLGNWMAPLDQYRPPGMGNFGPGGTMVYPSNMAFLPSMAGIWGQLNKKNPIPVWAGGDPAAVSGVGGGGLDSGATPDLAQLTQFFGDTGGVRRGGRIGFDDGGSVPTDYGLTPAAWGGGQYPDVATPYSGSYVGPSAGLTGGMGAPKSAPISSPWPVGAPTAVQSPDIAQPYSGPDIPPVIPGIAPSAPPADSPPGWGTGAVQMPGNPTWWSAGQYVPDPDQMKRQTDQSQIWQQPSMEDLNAMLASQQPGFGPPGLPSPEEMAGSSGGYWPQPQLPGPSWAEMGQGQVPGMAPPVGSAPPQQPNNSGGGGFGSAPANSPTGGFGAPHKIGGRAGFDEGGDVSDDSGMSGYARVLPMEGDIGTSVALGDSGATAEIPPPRQELVATGEIPPVVYPAIGAELEPRPGWDRPAASARIPPVPGGWAEPWGEKILRGDWNEGLLGRPKARPPERFESESKFIPRPEVEFRSGISPSFGRSTPVVELAPSVTETRPEFGHGDLLVTRSAPGIGDLSMSPDLGRAYAPGIGGTPVAAAPVGAPAEVAAPTIPTIASPLVTPRVAAAPVTAAPPPRGGSPPTTALSVPSEAPAAEFFAYNRAHPEAMLTWDQFSNRQQGAPIGAAPPQLTPPSATPQSGIAPGTSEAPVAPAGDAVEPFSLRSMPTVDPATGTTKDPKDMVAHYESEGAARRMGISAYNVGYGSTDLTNALKREDGFPIWEGKTFTDTDGQLKRTHAAGRYQFQPETWARYAGPLGIKDFSPESQDRVFRAAYAAEGFKPWAPFNPALAAALKSGAGVPVGGSTGPGATGTGPADQLVKAGATPQAAAGIQQAADRALSAVPESERSSMKEWMNSPYFLAFLAGAGMLASHSPFPGVALGEGLKTAATGAVQMRAQDTKEEIAQIRNQGILDKATASNSVAQARIEQGDEKLRQGNDRIALTAAKQAAELETKRVEIEKGLAALAETTRHHGVTEAQAAKHAELQNELIKIRQEQATPTRIEGVIGPQGVPSTVLVPKGKENDSSTWTYFPSAKGALTPQELAAEVTKLVPQHPDFMGNPKKALSEVLKMYGLTPQQYQQQILGVPGLLSHATPAAPGMTSTAPALPPAAVSQLKEGAVTTFGNGQKWTLTNGKPVQVP